MRKWLHGDSRGLVRVLKFTWEPFVVKYLTLYCLQNKIYVSAAVWSSTQPSPGWGMGSCKVHELWFMKKRKQHRHLKNKKKTKKKPTGVWLIVGSLIIHLFFFPLLINIIWRFLSSFSFKTFALWKWNTAYSRYCRINHLKVNNKKRRH